MKIIDTDWNEAKLIKPKYLSKIEAVLYDDSIIEGIFHNIINDVLDGSILYLIMTDIKERFVSIKYWRYI